MLNKQVCLLFLILLTLSMGSCRGEYMAVKHIKPKNYDRPYNPKQDRQAKRTKKVKRLIIRQRK